MKVYLGTKKLDGSYHYGMTIFCEKGNLLYSSVTQEEISEHKFANTLSALDWCVKKLKTLTQNKTLNEDEDITLFIPSKTVYTWLEKENAPDPYTVKLSDLFIEMSFLLNQLEIIFNKSASKKVLYRVFPEEKTTRLVDLFG